MEFTFDELILILGILRQAQTPDDAMNFKLAELRMRMREYLETNMPESAKPAPKK